MMKMIQILATGYDSGTVAYEQSVIFTEDDDGNFTGTLTIPTKDDPNEDDTGEIRVTLNTDDSDTVSRITKLHQQIELMNGLQQ